MDHRLIEGLMEVVVPAVREYVDGTLTKATAPLLADIEELKARKPEKGEPGQSVTLEDLRPLIEAEVATLPLPEPGKSVKLDDVRPLLDELVKSIPVPRDGEPGRDGKDAEPIQLGQVVEAIRFFDVEQLIKDAISGEHELDVVAPDAVAKEMALAVLLLSEPLQIKKEAPAVIVQQPTRPRRYTFEKDENNRVVAAVLEE